MSENTARVDVNAAILQLKDMLAAIDEMVGDVGVVRDFGKGSGSKFYEVIIRATLVRQREALNAIVALCESGHAAFAVCLLRPAYEESLWIEYLAMHPAEAPTIIECLTKIGMNDCLEAQNQYAGAKQMQELGFSQRFVKAWAAQTRETTATIVAIGRKLGWTRDRARPTVAEVARKVGKERDYRFIYEATSRFVHFSPHELCRRGWGNAREMRISSTFFADYWALFALHWGFRIFLDTLIASMRSVDGLDKEHGVESVERAERFLGLAEGYVQKVPIITWEELQWEVR